MGLWACFEWVFGVRKTCDFIVFNKDTNCGGVCCACFFASILVPFGKLLFMEAQVVMEFASSFCGIFVCWEPVGFRGSLSRGSACGLVGLQGREFCDGCL